MALPICTIAPGQNTGVKKVDALKSCDCIGSRGCRRHRDGLQVRRHDAGIRSCRSVPRSGSPDTSLAGQTPGKERYVRLLTGADAGSAAARATSGHWVDTFHHYGTGTNMDSLAQRNLPAASLANGAQDWEMNGTESIDVSSQVPALGTWSVNDQDFWNGCVMARWGAYWDAVAQPAGWTATDASNWPAKSDAARWTSGGLALTGAPLHLSDEPPDSGKPSTRFTAYSWPDARISGTSDVRLHAVLAETLVPGTVDTKFFVFRPPVDALADAGAHNNWTLPQDSAATHNARTIRSFRSQRMPLRCGQRLRNSTSSHTTLMAAIPFCISASYGRCVRCPRTGRTSGRLRMRNPLPSSGPLRTVRRGMCP